MAVNELECNSLFSFHVATEYLKVHFSYTVGKTGQHCKLQRGTLHEFFKSGGAPRFLARCRAVASCCVQGRRMGRICRYSWKMF